MINTAVILAGGFGTRLRSVINNTPKPMAPINNFPFLYYQLNYLKSYGIKKIIFSVGYMANDIKNYFGYSFNDLNIEYVIEKTPMGTGGGIRLALQQSEENLVLVLNGDSFFDINLNQFYNYHITENAQISLALREVDDASRYGTIVKNEENKIISFQEKNNLSQPGIINGGVYIIDSGLYLKHTPSEKNFSIEKDFFEKQITTLSIKGFQFNGYFIDIGIPEDYQKAQHDFKGFKYK
jgi:D-glycero-alpha-D-manno-heptose 1-phosphate guanylyltransferase